MTEGRHTGAPSPSERPRVAEQQNTIGERRIPVSSSTHILHTLCPVAPYSYRVAERPDVSASGEFKPWLHGNSVAGTPEAVLAANEVASRDTFVATCDADGN